MRVNRSIWGLFGAALNSANGAGVGFSSARSMTSSLVGLARVSAPEFSAKGRQLTLQRRPMRRASERNIFLDMLPAFGIFLSLVVVLPYYIPKKEGEPVIDSYDKLIAEYDKFIEEHDKFIEEHDKFIEESVEEDDSYEGGEEIILDRQTELHVQVEAVLQESDSTLRRGIIKKCFEGVAQENAALLKKVGKLYNANRAASKQRSSGEDFTRRMCECKGARVACELRVNTLGVGGGEVGRFKRFVSGEAIKVRAGNAEMSALLDELLAIQEREQLIEKPSPSCKP